MGAVFKREINAYFTSAIGYIFLGAFAFFSGLFFYMVNLQGSTAELNYVFSWMLFVYIFLIPILTMRLVSDDKRQKTDQVLLTSPVSLTGIVIAKFLAAFLLFTIGVCLLLVIAFALSLFGAIDVGCFFSSIIGMLLLGAALIAIGIFISSLTESQMIAAVGGIVVNLFLLIADTVASYISNSAISTALSAISIDSRYKSFLRGYVNIADTVYLLSVAVIFIFLTIRVLEKRRWS